MSSLMSSTELLSREAEVLTTQHELLQTIANEIIHAGQIIAYRASGLSDRATSALKEAWKSNSKSVMVDGVYGDVDDIGDRGLRDHSQARIIGSLKQTEFAIEAFKSARAALDDLIGIISERKPAIFMNPAMGTPAGANMTPASSNLSHNAPASHANDANDANGAVHPGPGFGFHAPSVGSPPWAGVIGPDLRLSFHPHESTSTGEYRPVTPRIMSAPTSPPMAPRKKRDKFRKRDDDDDDDDTLGWVSEQDDIDLIENVIEASKRLQLVIR